MGERVTGHCLCGACTLTAELVSGEAAVCHCSMCRRFSGGMLIVVDCGSSLEFSGPVRTYLSSDWGSRLFCGECGSSLAWRSRDGAMNYASVQAFPDPGRFPVNHEIFFDCKPASYALAGETAKMTEAEFMAAFAAGGEGHP